MTSIFENGRRPQLLKMEDDLIFLFIYLSTLSKPQHCQNQIFTVSVKDWDNLETSFTNQNKQMHIKYFVAMLSNTGFFHAIHYHYHTG